MEEINVGHSNGEVYYNPRPAPRVARILVEEATPRAGIQDAQQLATDAGGASSLSSVFTLCNTAIGAGVLGLPFAFRCSGLVGTLLLFAAVATLESFTMYVLAKYAERYDAPSYGSLIRRALGRKTGAGLSAVTVVYLWGSSVAYLVVVADTFTSLAQMHLGGDAWLSQRGVLLLVAGLLLLPCCFPRNLQAMEYVSGAAVVGFLYTAAAVSARGVQAAAARPDPMAGISLFHFDLRSLYAVSIVVFGFNCHANVVGVFWELEHYPHKLIPRLPGSPGHYSALGPFAPKPTTYKLIGMLGAIISYMSIILLGYTAVGISGYFAFPATVSSNVLNSFPADDTVIQVARAVIGGVCMGSYPLNHHPARKAWEDLLDAALGVRVVPGWLSALLTCTFVASTVGTAVLVTDLGSVLHLIGGTAAAFMVFLLPGLLLMNAAIIKHTTTAAGDAAAPASSCSGCSSQPGAAAAGPDAETPGSQAALLDSLAVPLLLPARISKKAGFRDAGLIFTPRKSWWAGLLLVVVAGMVMAITCVTAGS
ncbi:transmembrane amino acid transporter protein-domain-containing protein [Scenedesmus sp. NREL 46B-D3]|nr:transmembrane amino acid transporter protein-domain-containing protein [Scenedesmus sp. NREL 46B-D3]